MKPSFSLNLRLTTRQATVEDKDAIGTFLSEMLADFGLELDLNGVDGDLLGLPYSYEGGYFGLLEEDGKLIVGTYALFPLTTTIAEVRKMYLRPGLRGMGLGKQMLNFVENMAIELGYQRLELETSTAMTSAIALYEKTEYCEIDPIHDKQRCQHRYFKDLAR